MLTYNARDGLYYGTSAERLADTGIITMPAEKVYEYDTGKVYVTDGSAWHEV